MRRPASTILKSRALAPRLVQLTRIRLSQPQDESQYHIPERHTRLVRRARRPPPDLTRPRKSSILLRPHNPIERPHEFEAFKTPAPVLHEHKKSSRRVMTAHERDMFSNPYLRMLASPLRRCYLTDSLLPTDLLIRLAIQRVPVDPSLDNAAVKRLRTDGKGNILAILPDGAAKGMRTAGRGFYVVCERHLFDQIPTIGLIYGEHRRYQLHPRLGDFVEAQLQQCILNELEHVVNQLKHASRSSAGATICTRVTWDRWDSAVATGILDGPAGLHAVLLFREPKTRRRRKTDPPAPPEEPEESRHLINLPPRTMPEISSFKIQPTGEGCQHQHPVPLYDIYRYMPQAEQRKKLRELLGQLLQLERNAKWRSRAYTHSGDGQRSGPSEAYILSSSESSVLRADLAPVLIAFWRLRMWYDGHTSMMKSSHWGDRSTL